jgi:hypothetical protein
MDDFCCIFDVVLFDCREVLNELSVDLGTAIRDQFRSESGDVLTLGSRLIRMNSP